MNETPLLGPDEGGVRQAIERLLAAYSAAGSPVPRVGTSELPSELPVDGVGTEAALGWAVEAGIIQAARLDHPGYLAHMDPPTPWQTWVAHAIAASTNQNLLHPDTAPVGRALEQQVVGWLAPRFGMDGGHFVPGSSMANLTALWAARDLVGVQEVVASSSAHLSVRKAAHILGLAFRTVEVDAAQRLDVDRLGDLTHSALVLTAGTVASGSIDPLGHGASAAWRHVDAAWAGPLRLTQRHRALLDGIETADSVSVSGHKWLYQPKDSAIVLFADTDASHAALSFGESYLAAPNIGLLGSRSVAPALALAVTLLAVGTRGIARCIDDGMALADRLCATIAEHDDLELRTEHTTAVVNWRVVDVDPLVTQRKLEQTWVSVTEVAGTRWLRSVVANPNADVDHVVAEVLSASKRSKLGDLSGEGR